jgi:hypothetical protein
MSSFSSTSASRNHQTTSSFIVRTARLVALAGLLTAATPRGLAAETASAVITPISLGGNNFDYSIKLTDTGTTNVGTFWFAWIPGQDYLPVSPISEVSPAGWQVGMISHNGSSDGYAIQWVASSASSDLTPGSNSTNNSLTFSFKTTATPAQISGDSSFFPSTPVGTSFIYSGTPFSDAGDRLVATVATPEPSTLALTFAALLMGGLMVRWKSGTTVP